MTDKSHLDSVASAAGPAPTQRPRAESVTHSGGSPQSGTPPSPLAPGSLLGPYRLLEKLGEGGMGAVYKAQHEHLDKTVAIKVLPASLTADADAVARFKREMKAVGKVTHPNIVQAHDAGEIHGTHFLAMEFVPGSDLTKLVKERGPLPIDKACKILRQAALGLAAAHAGGLVHRDIKPANLLITKTGQVKLLDLGLARLATDKVNQTADLTAAGQTFGTPDYMAPEQWDDAHGVDGRCDLYALGCTLCFLLTGHAPFATADTASILKKLQAHANKPPPDLRALVPGIPDGLATLFEKLLAKNPADRPATATALAEALLPFTKSPSATDSGTAATLSTSAKPSRTRLDEELPQPLPSLRPVEKKSKSKPARPGRPKSWTLLAGGTGAVLLLGVIVITLTRPDGTKTTITVPGDTKIGIAHQADSTAGAPAVGAPGGRSETPGASVPSTNGT